MEEVGRQNHSNYTVMPMTVKWSHNIFLGIEFVNLSYRELCTQYSDSTFTDFNGKSWEIEQRSISSTTKLPNFSTRAIKVQIRSNSCKLILTMKGWCCKAHWLFISENLPLLFFLPNFFLQHPLTLSQSHSLKPFCSLSFEGCWLRQWKFIEV